MGASALVTGGKWIIARQRVAPVPLLR